MWDEVNEFLDKEFPGWECFEAEEQLYEPIEDLKEPLSFKGFIDGVLKVPKKRGKGHEYWIIDWKTAGAWGWRRDKKQDEKQAGDPRQLGRLPTQVRQDRSGRLSPRASRHAGTRRL